MSSSGNKNLVNGGVNFSYTRARQQKREIQISRIRTKSPNDITPRCPEISSNDVSNIARKKRQIETRVMSTRRICNVKVPNLNCLQGSSVIKFLAASN